MEPAEPQRAEDQDVRPVVSVQIVINVGIGEDPTAVRRKLQKLAKAINEAGLHAILR